MRKNFIKIFHHMIWSIEEKLWSWTSSKRLYVLRYQADRIPISCFLKGDFMKKKILKSTILLSAAAAYFN